MTDTAKIGSEAGQCPVCGTRLRPGTPAEMCPGCLLKAGLPSQESESAGQGGTILVQPASLHKAKGLPQVGEQFGHYRITRVLGGGGMGVVYEAEELESSRRVALKLLGH